ncbi:hypothetical protein BCR43DRAFT_494632 [Syncephalastrum racemosum]|uniref:Uncharacterized protein n=1 Tax=Syncephalastrum racemosum TaxID=13706 RepID=A0A1X2H8C9_SYNRA|nr:hypothetical protein BCR43DRAFT_494632 [Syncephalastrum racemosum]
MSSSTTFSLFVFFLADPIGSMCVYVWLVQLEHVRVLPDQDRPKHLFLSLEEKTEDYVLFSFSWHSQDLFGHESSTWDENVLNGSNYFPGSHYTHLLSCTMWR